MAKRIKSNLLQRFPCLEGINSEIYIEELQSAGLKEDPATGVNEDFLVLNLTTTGVNQLSIL